MNRAKYLQKTYADYEGSYNGVWIVEYENELYRIVLTGDFYTCHLLFDNEHKKIKDKELMLSLQAVIATELFRMAEVREKWEEERQTRLKK